MNAAAHAEIKTDLVITEGDPVNSVPYGIEYCTFGSDASRLVTMAFPASSTAMIERATPASMYTGITMTFEMETYNEEKRSTGKKQWETV